MVSIRRRGCRPMPIRACRHMTISPRWGRDEKTDPYHFGLSLLRQVQSAPRQEIATHTFSTLLLPGGGQRSRGFPRRPRGRHKGRRAARVAHFQHRVPAQPDERGAPAHMPRAGPHRLSRHRTDLVPPGAARGRAVGAGARLPPGRQLSAARRGTGSCANPWSTASSISRRAAFCGRRARPAPSNDSASNASPRPWNRRRAAAEFFICGGIRIISASISTQSGVSDWRSSIISARCRIATHACGNHGGNRERKTQWTLTGWF